MSVSGFASTLGNGLSAGGSPASESPVSGKGDSVGAFEFESVSGGRFKPGEVLSVVGVLVSSGSNVGVLSEGKGNASRESGTGDVEASGAESEASGGARPSRDGKPGSAAIALFV